jgi:SAM-dependent methyltransferase
MAHIEQQDFCISVRHTCRPHFENKTVLDFGSLDINGNNRGLFTDCFYRGIDLGPGPNVDIVSPAHLVPIPDRSIDVVVSTECLEHDEHWEKTLKKAYDVLKPGGLFFFSCATGLRGEHGTERTSPTLSPFTTGYYRNISEADVRAVHWTLFGVPMERLYCRLRFFSPDWVHDLYFRGIKI